MSGKKYILLVDLIPILNEWAGFKGNLEDGLNLIEHNPTSTGHGNCCTCQDCGYFHDDCVCTHNTLVEELDKVIRY